MKVVRELGLERRETVRSLSTVDVRKLKGLDPSTRGPGKVDPLWTGCSIKSIARKLHPF